MNLDEQLRHACCRGVRESRTLKDSDPAVDRWRNRLATSGREKQKQATGKTRHRIEEGSVSPRPNHPYAASCVGFPSFAHTSLDEPAGRQRGRTEANAIAASGC